MPRCYDCRRLIDDPERFLCDDCAQQTPNDGYRYTRTFALRVVGVDKRGHLIATIQLEKKD